MELVKGFSRQSTTDLIGAEAQSPAPVLPTELRRRAERPPDRPRMAALASSPTT